MNSIIKDAIALSLLLTIGMGVLIGVCYPFSYIEEDDYKEVKKIYSEGKPETNAYIDEKLKEGKLMVADLYLIRTKSNEEKDTIKYKKIVYEKRAN